MKVEGWLFLGCGIFFGGADIVYWYVSKEPTGTDGARAGRRARPLTGFYMLFTGRRLPKRPEDDDRGEIEQGTGEIGFFSPHSWWPLFVGLACADRRARLRDRLVAVPHRHAGRRVHLDRLRLRVLPRQLLALARPLATVGR